jgi:hypothetical protein
MMSRYFGHGCFHQSASTRLFVAVLLCTLLGQACAAGPPHWVVSQEHGRIEVFSEFRVDPETLMVEIANVESELSSLLNLPARTNTVQLVLFRNHANYVSYLGNRLPEAKTRRALFFQNGDTGQIYAVQGRMLLTDLRHEFTHALLHQHLSFVPLWLDEGLAEYFENPRARRLDSTRVTGLKWKARFGWKASLTELESLNVPLEMTAADYANSWAVVCFLINHSSESRQILQDYVQTISRGEAPGRFSRFAARVFPELSLELNSYFRNPTIRLTSGSPQ